MGCGVKRLNVEFHFSSASISEIILFLHCLPCARHKHPWQKHIYYIYKKQTIPGIFIFFFLPQFIGELKKLPVPTQVCAQRWNRECLTIIEGGISRKAEGELQKPSCSFCQWVFPSSCCQQCWWFFLVSSTSLSCWCPWSTASNLYKIVLWEDFQFSLQQHQQLLPLPTILCQLISWMALIVFCVNCNVVQVCTCLCFWLSSALKPRECEAGLLMQPSCWNGSWHSVWRNCLCFYVVDSCGSIPKLIEKWKGLHVLDLWNQRGS